MAEKQNLKVLYVEDSQQAYDAVRYYLGNLQGYELIESRVQTMKAAELILRTDHPDILLLDLDLPQEGPDKPRRIRTTAEHAVKLRQEMPHLTILVHSGEDKLRSEAVRIIILAGISYLTKEAITGPEHLDWAIKHARTGGAVYDRHVVRFFDKILSGNGLSTREWQGAALVQKKTDRQIADCLKLSPRTVSERVSRILEKKGFTNRAELAVWYHEQAKAGNAPLPPDCGE